MNRKEISDIIKGEELTNDQILERFFQDAIFSGPIYRARLKRLTVILEKIKLKKVSALKCPHCGSADPHKTTRGFKCSNNTCYKKFSEKSTGPLRNSKVSLDTWNKAMELYKEGSSTRQAAKVMGVTQKTAWGMKQRLKNPDAVALGRLGGLKGGRARAESLSKERRQEIAKKAAEIRWK